MAQTQNVSIYHNAPLEKGKQMNVRSTQDGNYLTHVPKQL
jgi:hypothetical protein